MFNYTALRSIKDIFCKIANSQFVCNLTTLSFGTFIAQVIPFFATMVLTRLYIPDEMGEWGVFSSYGSILAILGTLRYEGAIVRSKSERDAYYVTYLSLAVALTFTFILLVVAALIANLHVNISLNSSALYLLPAYVLVLLLVQILSNLATYLKRYKLIATNTINRSLSQSLGRILLGFVQFNRQGMLYGSILGVVVSILTLGSRTNLTKYIKGLDLKYIKSLAYENKDFPKFDLPSNLLNSISSHCPPIILAYYFQEYVVGIFSMAHTLLYIPMALIGSSISQLYYKKASELYHANQSIADLTKKLFLALYTIGIVFLLFIMLTEGWLFQLLLGQKWAEAGHYASILSPWLLLVTALSPLSPVFYVKNKQKLNMKLNILGVVLRVLSLVIGGSLFGSSDIAVFSFTIASTLFYVLQGIYIIKLGEVYFSTKEISVLSFITLTFIIIYIWRSI